MEIEPKPRSVIQLLLDWAMSPFRKTPARRRDDKMGNANPIQDENVMEDNQEENAPAPMDPQPLGTVRVEPAQDSAPAPAPIRAFVTDIWAAGLTSFGTARQDVNDAAAEVDVAKQDAQSARDAEAQAVADAETMVQQARAKRVTKESAITDALDRVDVREVAAVQQARGLVAHLNTYIAMHDDDPST